MQTVDANCGDAETAGYLKKAHSYLLSLCLKELNHCYQSHHQLLNDIQSLFSCSCLHAARAHTMCELALA